MQVKAPDILKKDIVYSELSGCAKILTQHFSNVSNFNFIRINF